MTRRVLVTYPNGTESVAEVVQREDYAWVRGHGELDRLITQQQCTVVQLVAATNERREALFQFLYQCPVEYRDKMHDFYKVLTEMMLEMDGD